jgi:predicted phage terminase large subunit-like protein
MKILAYRNDPNFRGVLIRQTNVQLSQSGGLFMEAQAMWTEYGCKFKSHPQMTATFPSGAQVQFKVCGADRDINNFDGGQFSLCAFDEAQWHSEVQIKYLESRIRSKAKGPHQLIATANPNMDCYLYQFVKWYLDMDTGIPKPELSGIERYYAVVEGSTVVGASIAELQEKYGPTCKPQSYTYISATVADNPIMRQLNPSYVDRLENLKRTERARLYLGSWHARQEDSQLWLGAWVPIINTVPEDLSVMVRGYDLAASKPSEANGGKCDWTCGVLIGKGKTTGHYYIMDAFKIQERPDGVLKAIINQAIEDGDRVKVVLPKDSGAGGAVAHSYYKKVLAENGIPSMTSVMSGHSGKVQRFAPFSALCESGNVSMIRGDWNKWYIDCLEDFTGRRGGFDDPCDATSDAANACMRSVATPIFVLPTMSPMSSPIPKI